MTDGVTLIVATRNRPTRFVDTVKITAAHMTRDDSRILVCVDDDDKDTIARLEDLPKDPRVLVSIKPREDTRGEKYDRALTEAPGYIYIPAHDCNPASTMGFDERILKKAKLFPDGIGVIHTEFIHRGTFPPAWQGMTAKWVEKIGYIYSHDYPFWFIDHEIHDLARMIGRYFYVDIAIPQDHPGKTFRLRELEFWTSYYDLMTLERRAKARAIIDGSDFLTPEWQKVDLRENYEKIENEARRINDGVRRNAATYQAQRGENGPPDEGYMRAKARAEQKLSTFLEALRAAA